MPSQETGPGSTVLELGPEDFPREVEGHRGLVLVDFHAQWCGPCHMVAPIVGRLAREFAGRVKVVKLDVDAAPSLAAAYGARTLPTVLLLRDGVELERWVGAMPYLAYLERLAGHVPPHSSRG